MQHILKILHDVRRLFDTLYAGYRAKLIMLSVVGLFAGLIEGVGITLLVPLFSTLLGSTAIGDNVIMQSLNHLSAVSGVELGFKALIIGVAVLFILKAVLLFWYGRIKMRIVGGYKVAIRSRIYERVLKASFSYLKQQKLGHIDYMVLTDVEASAKLLENAIQTVLNVSTLITYAVVAFALSPSITLVALAAGMLLLLFFRPFDRKMRAYTTAMATTAKDISHSISETLMGVKAVKAYGVEHAVLRTIVRRFKEHEATEIQKQDIKTLIKVSVEPLSVIFVLSVFAVSYSFLTFDVAAFVPIVYLIQQIFLRVEKIQNSKNVISSTIPHAETIQKNLADIAEGTETMMGSKPFAFKKEIRFDHVWFRYGKETTIRDVSFTVKKGETLGIVGPSGSGKTTIADLLLAFIPPQQGVIEIDGVSLGVVDRGLFRSGTAYVAQDVFLRNESILENIRFYDESISHEKVVDAAKRANIYDFISALPDGFSTVVGERGTRLSGGERQRIALARALVRNPEILVLDEATSALDAHSEGLIKETLRALKGEVTMVIIAHRLSTVLDADQIIVIEKGAIAEKGNPLVLLKNTESYFSKMMAYQSLEPHE